ncbi:MAG: methyltransferase domain-containing protein [Cumulibacter sp.]
MSTATSALPNNDAVLGLIRGLVGDRKVRVLDLGGGSGAYAVAIAADGHRVQVLDHSNDALATLARRAESAGVGDRVSGRNVDLDNVREPFEVDSADIVLCHRVLELVGSPQDILSAAAAALPPGGTLSVVAANRPGVALSRIISGRLEEADAILDHSVPGPAGRRFDADELTELLESLDLQVTHVRGVGLLGELNPAEAEAAGARELAQRVAADPYLARAAPLLHIVAVRGNGA